MTTTAQEENGKRASVIVKKESVETETIEKEDVTTAAGEET